MNIFKVIGKLSYHTKKASTVAIQQPKKAWSDIKQGYEDAQHFDYKKPVLFPDPFGDPIPGTEHAHIKKKPTQGEFDFGGNK